MDIPNLGERLKAKGKRWGGAGRLARGVMLRRSKHGAFPLASGPGFPLIRLQALVTGRYTLQSLTQIFLFVILSVAKYLFRGVDRVQHFV